MDLSIYSNWLAKAVSGCNNYGKQRFSDNLTAAIVVSDIQESLRNRFFNRLTSIFPKSSVFATRRQSNALLKKSTFNSFLDSKNDDSSSQIVATTLFAAVIAA